MLRLPGPHRGKCARLLTLTNTSSPDCHPKEMAEKKLTESKHCHGPVTLRFSGEPPRFWDEPMLVLVCSTTWTLLDHRGQKAPSASVADVC